MALYTIKRARGDYDTHYGFYRDGRLAQSALASRGAIGCAVQSARTLPPVATTRQGLAALLRDWRRMRRLGRPLRPSDYWGGPLDASDRY